MKSPKPRRGRPPRADKAALERLEIRLTKLERAAWEHAAAKVGVSLSEWIRQSCQVGAQLQDGGRIVVVRQGPTVVVHSETDVLPR